MPQVRPIAKIHAAAAYFAFISRDPKQIAKAFNLKNVRTVHRWAETEEWTEGLDACNYTGDRAFEYAPAQEGFSEAHAVYIAAITLGHPKHKLATLTAERVGEDPRRIRRWAEKYGWRAENP